MNDAMRTEWNQRANTDAHFYVAFGRRNQSEEEFFATAADVMPAFEQEFPRLIALPNELQALEIGCGPGRLMLSMSRYFGGVHGVDVSDDMLALARQRLRDQPNLHLHQCAGSDLKMFSDGSFDFVYSYAVFQHIPSADIVISYLSEAQRVLRPGGVLRCQIRGVAPLPSEMLRASGTWTGCWFTAEDLAKFSKERRFPLVAISGLNTQYMWATFRKPVEPSLSCSAAKMRVKAITAAADGGSRIPNRGPAAAASLWIDGAVDSISLAEAQVYIGDGEQLGCYVSPVSAIGGCQLNTRLLDGLDPGEYQVKLMISGQTVPSPHPIDIFVAPPHAPRVISVSDGINLRSENRIETSSSKVSIEDLGNPGQVSFTLAGLAVEELQHECTDPITSRFDFAFKLAPNTPAGRQSLIVRVGDHELDPIALEITG